MLAIYLQMISDEREHAKFERIYIEYKSLMFHRANQLLNNIEDAEDAVHMAFESIAKNIKRISDVNCPETRSFVVIIVERKAIDILRKRKGYAELGLDEAIAGIEIPPPGDGGLADAMAKLKPDHREVLILHYANGYTAKEIAKMFDMKQDSVQKRIWRAKDALLKILEEEGIEV